jgi:hypothetical protein
LKPRCVIHGVPRSNARRITRILIAGDRVAIDDDADNIQNARGLVACEPDALR